MTDPRDIVLIPNPRPLSRMVVRHVRPAQPTRIVEFEYAEGDDEWVVVNETFKSEES